MWTNVLIVDNFREPLALVMRFDGVEERLTFVIKLGKWGCSSVDRAWFPKPCGGGSSPLSPTDCSITRFYGPVAHRYSAIAL